MPFYCIIFMRQFEDDNTEHSFFVYAETKQKAIQRFCITTGYKKASIISVYEMGEMAWDY